MTLVKQKNSCIRPRGEREGEREREREREREATKNIVEMNDHRKTFMFISQEK